MGRLPVKTHDGVRKCGRRKFNSLLSQQLQPRGMCVTVKVQIQRKLRQRRIAWNWGETLVWWFKITQGYWWDFPDQKDFQHSEHCDGCFMVRMISANSVWEHNLSVAGSVLKYMTQTQFRVQLKLYRFFFNVCYSIHICSVNYSSCVLLLDKKTDTKRERFVFYIFRFLST